MKKSWFAFILTFLIILAGCNRAQTNTNVPNNADNSSKGKDTKTQGILYTNNDLGFSMEFPKSWEGNYLVKQYIGEFIEVSFIGKSIASKIYIDSEGWSDGNGLPMFYIFKSEPLNEKAFKSVKKIAAINGVDYYYATGTGDPIGTLDLSGGSSMNDLVTNEAEKDLMKADFAKAKKMEGDIESILKTLKPYEGKLIKKSLTKEELFSYMELPKNEILNTIGDKYRLIATGIELHYIGYCYDDLGVSFAFDDDDDTVAFVDCFDEFDFNGAKAGMNFAEIQKKLGKTAVEENFNEAEGYMAYELKYSFGKYIVSFSSFEKDGRESYITVYRRDETDK